MEGQHKEPRISSTQAALLIGTAVLFDLISFIPAIGQAISEVGSLVVFSIWFLILRVPLISPKKLIGWIAIPIIEAIPILSALPSITVGVILMIMVTRTEDRLGVQVLSTKGIANPTQIVGQIAGKVTSPKSPDAETPEPRTRIRPNLNDIRPRGDQAAA